MAVSIANITTGTDSDGNSTATTASVTLTAGRLYELTVTSRTGITADPNQPTATSTGATWVVDTNASVVYDNTSSSRRRITVLRTMVVSNQTGTISIDFAAQNQTIAEWSLDEFSGVDTTGTNGSGAIAQVKSNFDATATASSLTVTFNSVPTSGFVFGVFGNGNGTNTSTAGTGFTKSGDVTDSADIRTTTEYQATNDQTVDMSWSAASEVGGIAIEIKAAAVVATTQPTAFMTANTKFWGM